MPVEHGLHRIYMVQNDFTHFTQLDMVLHLGTTASYTCYYCTWHCTLCKHAHSKPLLNLPMYVGGIPREAVFTRLTFCTLTPSVAFLSW